MRFGILLAGSCFLVAGCQGNGNGGDNRSVAEKATDADSAYTVVFREELQGAKQGETVYLFVDGKDPAPELLKRLRKHWPELQPGSTVPAGKANRISLDRLKWIDHNHAELHGGFSNGMDGQGNSYLLENRDGAWVVARATLEEQS